MIKKYHANLFRELKIIIKDKINPLGFEVILNKSKSNIKILDIGCGNDSPRKVKKILPASYYIGLDIQDYNQTSKSYADEYHIVKEEDFNKTIASFKDLDLIISYHNIEHVSDRDNYLKAVKKALRKGGMIFIATPSEESVNFPSREGTLNYYDDPSHISKPIIYSKLLKKFEEDGFTIVNSRSRYRPFMYYLIGFFKELLKPKKTTFYAWCYYGFEMILLAEK